MFLILYHSDSYRELTLEGSDNMDCNVVLNAREYCLRRSVQLRLEVRSRRWILHTGPECHVQDCGGVFRDLELTDGRVINLVTAAGDRLTLVAVDRGDVLPVTHKFAVDSLTRLRFGSDEDNEICYSFQNLVSKHHGELVRQRDGVYLVDHSTNGTYCNGRKQAEPRRLAFGDQVQIFGLMMVYLGSILCVVARAGELRLGEQTPPVLHETAAQVVNRAETPRPPETIVNRSPRVRPELWRGKVTIEAAPDQHPQKRKPLLLTIGPSLTMALPMLLGALMVIYGMQASGGSSSAFMYTGLIVAVGSGILGAVWAVLNLRQQKQDEYQAERARIDAYGNYLTRQAATLREQYRHNAAALNQTYPPAGTLCGYSTQSPQLWNRNPAHEDFLFQRLGLGSVPFQVEIEIPQQRFSLQRDLLQERPAEIRAKFAELKDVPVGVDLRKEKLIGVVGGAGQQGAPEVVYSLLAGMAATACYTDVKIAMVCADGDRQRLRQWDFVRWLPHTWNENRTMRYFAAGKREAGDVFFALCNILRQRLPAEQGDTSGRELPHPHYVLIVEDAGLLEGELIAKYVYSGDRSLGLTTILLAQWGTDLPNACECIIQNDGQFAGMFHPMQGDACPIRFDRPGVEQLRVLAHTLVGLRVHEPESSTEIPDQVDFLTMYGVHSLEELHVADRWRKNRTYDSLRVPIGIKAGGGLCSLDIHEKFHGPHGLVAGTTGSGKSETLQTYILSLAVNFSPEDVGFFVIDFKGGGMANLFDGLPHMLGQISNLSGNQIRRAMISIKSENRRRQRIFNEYGVNSINQYTRLYRNGEAEQPIPHLFLIIDEFAELKREEPDFMRELISVAQVGRSLGVHLILATQKPSGTVDDNIWSNAKFRLCLRVQTRQDSTDMLHKPDAAFITQAGRCFLQVGNDEIYEQFQSAWSGAPYHEGGDRQGSAAAVLLTRSGRTGAATAGQIRQRRQGQAAEQNGRTQLGALVQYLADTAREQQLRPCARLWLPLLPTRLDIRQLEGWAGRGFDGVRWPERQGDWTLDTPVGLCDDPYNQLQLPLTVDFAASGHLAVCASVFSGKSTLLQTIVYGLLMRCSPEQLNLYLLDFSSQMLSCFAAAPQVGAVMDESDLDFVGNFLCLLETMLDERKKLLKGGNYSQYIRTNGLALPAVVVVIDNYAAFSEKTGGRYEPVLLRAAREGVSYGVFLLASASGFGMGGIPNRIAENLKTVLCLGLGDKFQYMELLHTSGLRVLPEPGIPGRGMAMSDGVALEFQAALAFGEEDDYARSRAIAGACEAMAAAWQGVRARPVPRIPEHPTFSLLQGEAGYAALRDDPATLPVGYLRETARLYAIDLTRTYCYLVAGREHSGRHNTMKLLMQAAADKGAQIVTFEKGGERLSVCTARLGGRYLSTDGELFAFWQDFSPEFTRRNQRKRQAVEEGCTEGEIFDRMKTERPVCIFLADLTEFFRSVYTPEAGVGGMKGFMETILQKGALHNIYFFAAMRLEDAATLNAWAGYRYYIARRSGVLLGGNVGAQRVFSFQNIPFNQLSKPLPKGIGLAADPEDETLAQTIVLPQAER